jgi:hypothetical protein
VQQPEAGSNKLWINVQSPDSGIIEASRQTIWGWLMSAGKTTWEPWMCIDFTFGGRSWSVPLGIPGTFVVRYEITIPEDARAAFNDALWKGQLSLSVGFPTETDVRTAATLDNRTCTNQPFSGTVPLDPESGRPMTLTIPVAAAISYGAIYRWPVNNLTTGCFVYGVGCDSVYTSDSRETIDAASCSGGECTLERQQAGGYYQVSSTNMIALIVGITFGVLIFAAMLVGSAVYFRRNPDKWDAVKQWGPNKYKELERSLKTRV